MVSISRCRSSMMYFFRSDPIFFSYFQNLCLAQSLAHPNTRTSTPHLTMATHIQALCHTRKLVNLVAGMSSEYEQAGTWCWMLRIATPISDLLDHLIAGSIFPDASRRCITAALVRHGSAWQCVFRVGPKHNLMSIKPPTHSHAIAPLITCQLEKRQATPNTAAKLTTTRIQHRWHKLHPPHMPCDTLFSSSFLSDFIRHE